MEIRMSLCKGRNASTLPEELVPPEALPKLPEELVMWEVLPKLPARSLIRFKSVSKEWRDFITNDAGLKKAHARHRMATARNSNEISLIALKSVDNELVLLTGDDRGTSLSKARDFETPRELTDLIYDNFVSSNGLVLASNPLSLWNPATSEFRVLPEPIADSKYRPVLGLGFDEESEDHKVVRITRDQNYPETWSLNLQVFSKRAGSWRKLRPLPGFTLITDRVRNRVSHDGVLYFLALQGSHPYPKTVVMSFTYRSEEVRKVADEPDPFGSRTYYLNLLRWKEDSLALIFRDLTSTKRYVYDFWVMTKNVGGGDGCCWSKLFVSDDYNVIRGVWSDRILITRKMTELALWDPRTDGDKHNCLVLAKLKDSAFYHVTHYVPTLVSVFPDPY